MNDESRSGPGDGTGGTHDASDLPGRLAGKDRALTRTIQERDEAIARAEAAERRAETLAAEREEAQLTAKRVQLEAKYPLAVEALGSRLDFHVDDNDFLASMEARLGGGEREPREPRMDTNVGPRRSWAPPPEDDSIAGLERRLERMGNPYS